MEEFRSLSYIDDYQISNLGRVRNTKTNRILVLNIRKNKFNKILKCVVMIKKKIYFAHRLVADAFIENPENKPFVDHIDRDPTNNNVTNLRWATPLENSNNRSKHKNNTTGESNIMLNKKTKKYRIVIKNDNKVYYFGLYDTFEEAKEAKETGNYKRKKSNVNEKNVRFNVRRKKYEFRKEVASIVYSKFFDTLQEAVIYRDEFLNTL